MSELQQLARALRAEIESSNRAYLSCKDGFMKMMLAGEFGALSKVLACVERAASAIEARRAATTGAVHESAVAKPDAQTTPGGHNG